MTVTPGKTLGPQMCLLRASTVGPDSLLCPEHLRGEAFHPWEQKTHIKEKCQFERKIMIFT